MTPGTQDDFAKKTLKEFAREMFTNEHVLLSRNHQHRKSRPHHQSETPGTQELPQLIWQLIWWSVSKQTTKLIAKLIGGALAYQAFRFDDAVEIFCVDDFATRVRVHL